VTSDAVLTELSDHVLVVTINRPEARNAVNREVWEGLGEALELAQNSPQVRVVVVTGAGDRAFCAGMDLKSVASGEFQGDRPPSPRQEGWGFAGFVSHPISKPIIAAVNGDAMGGGWEIVLACDLVVASQTARFGFPEVKVGLIAGGGGSFRLPRQIPRPLAMQLLLTGDIIDAYSALQLGLLAAVVPPSQLLDHAMQLAQRIAANAPLAVAATKRLARGMTDGREPAEDGDWLRAAEEVARVVASADAQEGPRAFVEKRPPVWQGR
jgi:crotonobetainyl-CoA hydratase